MPEAEIHVCDLQILKEKEFEEKKLFCSFAELMIWCSRNGMLGKSTATMHITYRTLFPTVPMMEHEA